jgi:hypothetical protein
LNPSIKTVTRARYWIRFIWRLGAVLMLLWTLWITKYYVTNIFNGLFEPDMMPMRQARYFVLEALPYLIIAALMLLLERFVVRWLAPLPVRGCANCGYPDPAKGGKCPECGFDGGEV